MVGYLCTAVLAALPGDFSEGFATAHDALVAGELDAARRGYEACFEWSPQNATVAFHLACVEARAGDVERALAWLDAAAEAGYDDGAVALFEPDLASLRGLARFDAAVARMEELARARGPAPERPRIVWDPNLAQASLAPDGETIVTGRSGDAFLWHAAAGECLAVLAGPGRAAYGPRFRAGGLLVAAANRDGTIRLWDGRTGAELLDLSSGEPTTRVAVSTDGAWLLGSDYAKPTTLIDVPQRAAVAVLPESARLATLSADGSRALLDAPGRSHVHLLRLPSGEVLTRVDGLAGGKARGGFSPDGRHALVRREGGEVLVVLDAADGAELARIPIPPTLVAATLAGDGPTLVTLDGGGRVTWRGPFDGRELAAVESGITSHPRWAVARDGADVVVGDGARVRGFRSGGELAWERELGGRANAALSLWVSADGRRTLVQPTWEGRVLVLDEGGAERASFGSPFLSCIRPAIAPDGSLAVLPTTDGTLRFLDLAEARVIAVAEASVQYDAFVGQIAELSPDAERLATTHADGFLRVWSTRGELRWEVAAFRTKRWSSPSVVWSADGGRLLTFGDGQPAQLWTADAELVRVLGEGNAVDASFRADGERIVVAEQERGGGRARVYDGRTGEARSGVFVHENALLAAALDPTGRWLATGAADSRARVFALNDERLVHAFDHPDVFETLGVPVVRFGPRGRTLVTTTSSWFQVHAWDVESGERLWDHDFGGGNPGSVDARFIGDSENVHVEGLGVRHARTGETVVEKEVRAYTPDGGTYVRTPRHRADFLDGGELALRLRYGLLWDGYVAATTEGFLDVSPGAAERVYARAGEALYGLDAFASRLLDPKRVRAAANRIPLHPARVPPAPELELLAPRRRVERVAPGATSVELRAAATVDGGVLGFEVVRDGERVERTLVNDATTFDEGGRGSLVLTLPWDGTRTESTVRVRAIARSGVLSAAAYTSWRVLE